MNFEIELSPEGLDHLRFFQKRDQTTLLAAIRRQLADAPSTATRHRKPMRSNVISNWELRVGDFRVYYDIDESTRTVLVRAIGVKIRNRVLIGGEEVDLS